MEFVQFSQVLSLLSMASILLFMLGKVIYSCWILPKLRYRKLRTNGFDVPAPIFPLGNINDMKEELKKTTSPSLSISNHDIHSFAFHSRWQKLHGKVYIYWLGTEPFLYIADPKLIKKMSTVVMGKSWGKPRAFKRDRDPLFGNGLIMVEGDKCVKHRHVINPAFSPASLNVSVFHSLYVGT